MCPGHDGFHVIVADDDQEVQQPPAHLPPGRHSLSPEHGDFRVIVVDDDQEMRRSLVHLLTRAGWQIKDFSKAENAIEQVDRFGPDVVLADVRMPGMNGIDLLKHLMKQEAPPVVLISAHGDIPMAVEAMQQGAYSFLEKPFDPRRLLNILQHAAEQYRMKQDTSRLRHRLAELSGLDRILLGQTDVIRSLREDLVDLSTTSANVLVLGKTGTGKELVARALHDLGPRGSGPFVAVNCAAIPTQHFEATLFGTVDGQRGLVMQANTGTLFLDEISSCPIEAQAKLVLST